MNDSHLCQNVGRFIQMHFNADIFPQNHNSLSQNNKNKPQSGLSLLQVLLLRMYSCHLAYHQSRNVLPWEPQTERERKQKSHPGYLFTSSPQVNNFT